MTLGITTILLPIAPGKAGDVRAYLKANADPLVLDQGSGKLECQPDFPFHLIKGLHFCSFVILPPLQGESGETGVETLVFEATFDGTSEAFLDDALQHLPVGLGAVLANCIGYPATGMTVPQLVKNYLLRHVVAANTFFSGSPGRRASQIIAENDLRRNLISFLRERHQPTKPPLPTTLSGVQKELQAATLAGPQAATPNLSWAAQKAPVPWEVAWRDSVVRCVIAVLLGLAALFGALVLHWAGYGTSYVVGHLSGWLQQLEAQGNDWFGWTGSISGLAVVPALFALTGGWLFLRVVELLVRQSTQDPHQQTFLLRFPLQIAVIVRHALLSALVAVLALTLLTVGAGRATPPTGAPNKLQVAVQSLDRKLILSKPISATVQSDGTLRPPVSRPDTDKAPATAADRPPPAVLTSLLLLSGLGLIFGVLSYVATSLRLAVQFAELSTLKENVRRFHVDVVGCLKVLTVLIGCLVVARHVPESIRQYVSDALLTPLKYGIVLVADIFAGLLAAYLLLALPLLLFIRLRERRDGRTFLSPDKLIGLPNRPADTFAREECGTNIYQNHLASLTEVKPGMFRAVMLRSTLFVVHLLARFYFTRGELGQIQTILSARWVLIDGGRRLLFLDNYTGAWESYLNEFIDMEAVKGLNAIWTNTFIRAGTPSQAYAFPPTDYYIWNGAQAERPFKDYVRHSQIETLVWYGAYPALSIKNINANTDIRQALFDPLQEHQLDAFVQKL